MNVFGEICGCSHCTDKEIVSYGKGLLQVIKLGKAELGYETRQSGSRVMIFVFVSSMTL